MMEAAAVMMVMRLMPGIEAVDVVAAAMTAVLGTVTATAVKGARNEKTVSAVVEMMHAVDAVVVVRTVAPETAVVTNGAPGTAAEIAVALETAAVTGETGETAEVTAVTVQTGAIVGVIEGVIEEVIVGIAEATVRIAVEATGRIAVVLVVARPVQVSSPDVTAVLMDTDVTAVLTDTVVAAAAVAVVAAAVTVTARQHLQLLQGRPAHLVAAMAGVGHGEMTAGSGSHAAVVIPAAVAAMTPVPMAYG